MRLLFQITVVSLLVLFICSIFYFTNAIDQEQYNRINKRTKAIEKSKELNIELSMVAKRKFDLLGINFSGEKIFEQFLSNENCNKSDYIIVYLSNEDLLQTCLYFTKFIDNKEWDQTLACRETRRNENRPDLSFQYIGGEARKHGEKEFLSFSTNIFPKNSHYPYFLPVGTWANEDYIVDYAKKRGSGFFYIHYSYRGEYDQYKYPCNQNECECANENYARSIDATGQEKTLIRGLE